MLLHKLFRYLLSKIFNNSINNKDNKDFLEDFIMSTFYNQIYTSIGIGRPIQNVLISINTKQVDFLFNKMNCLYFYNNNYIDKSNLNPNNKSITINITHIGYNKNLSKTFKKNNNTKLSLAYKNNNYFPAKESVKIADYRNILKNKNLDEEIYPYCQDNLNDFGLFVKKSIMKILKYAGLLGLIYIMKKTIINLLSN